MAAISMALLLPGAGCRFTPACVPVSGRIEVDGVPLTSGAIVVVPDAGRPASGRIGTDGRFTLSTLRPGDGVVRGTHRVVVTAFRDEGQTRHWLVPAACREIPTTPLRLQVDGPRTDVVVSIDTGGQPPDVEVTAAEDGSAGGA